MLDDLRLLEKRDSEKTLDSAVEQPAQAQLDLPVQNKTGDHHTINQIVVAGMGGSALAAQLVASWLESSLRVPIEIVRTYQLPNYVNETTLVVASSCSGNTEETLEALADARTRGATVAIVSKGGKLIDIARTDKIEHVQLPNLQIQPRMLTIAQVVALTNILIHHDLVHESCLVELRDACQWLQGVTDSWSKTATIDKNPAKQLALHSVGKTGLFVGGPLMRAAAYKWKISWNENAKNVAFWSELPELNHNEFIGWTSHPIEKPFAVYDIVSNLEHPQVQKRFELTDRLLSGKRPKATVIRPEGDTLLKQLLWVSLFADFTSIYLGILNNVDPGPVPLVERLKKEL